MVDMDELDLTSAEAKRIKTIEEAMRHFQMI
jgi:hypothetical protein